MNLTHFEISTFLTYVHPIRCEHSYGRFVLLQMTWQNLSKPQKEKSSLLHGRDDSCDWQVEKSAVDLAGVTFAWGQVFLSFKNQVLIFNHYETSESIHICCLVSQFHVSTLLQLCLISNNYCICTSLFQSLPYFPTAYAMSYWHTEWHTLLLYVTK